MIKKIGILTVLCATLVGCNRGTVSTDEAFGVAAPVVQRHDEYVTSDELLSDEQKSEFLAESQAVSDYLTTDEDEVEAGPLFTLWGPVSERHDAYINGDESLPAVEKRVFLRSSALMGHMLFEAMNNGDDG